MATYRTCTYLHRLYKMNVTNRIMPRLARNFSHDKLKIRFDLLLNTKIVERQFIRFLIFFSSKVQIIEHFFFEQFCSTIDVLICHLLLLPTYETKLPINKSITKKLL